MAQHTPGPWEPTNSWNRYCHDREPDDDMMSYHTSIMAEAPFTENEAGDFEEIDKQAVASANGRTEEEMKANGHLIVAAPELLKALKELVKIADAYSDEMRQVGRGAHELGTDAPDMSVSWLAKQAIAKAEGRA